MAVDLTTTGDGAPSDRIVSRRDLQGLVVASMLAAVAAAVLPLFAGGDVVGLQVVVALAAVVWFAIGVVARNALTVALGAIALECVLALPGTEFPVVVVPAAGVCALAAAEGLSLTQMWRSRGVLRWDSEVPHVRAALERVGIGAGAALAVTLVGFVELPSAAVVVALGAVALGAVVWTLASRAS